MEAKHVAVLMGGWSSERDVSIWSGNTCADALERQGFRVTRVDVNSDIVAMLEDLKPDIAFNMLHGGVGGNGAIQGMLEILRIPYTHSGIHAASLATHKDKTRLVLAAAGVPVPNGKVISRFQAAREHTLSRPYVIKPLAEGSSLGLHFIMEDEPPLHVLASNEWKFGDLVLCEEFISGKELACGVIGDCALDIVETFPAAKFNDNQEKMLPAGSKTVVPAQLPKDVYAEIQRLAVLAHVALGCRGVSRADFRFNESKPGFSGLYCLEVNNQPGMTDLSLLPEMAAARGISYDNLVRWILDDASLNR